MRKAIFVCSAAVAAIVLGGCEQKKAEQPAPRPPNVSVAQVTAEPVPLRFQYAGRVSAFREVEIRARVSGILQEKSFVEGRAVKEGEVLFRIEPATYEAALASAEAQLREAEATVERTKRDADRASTLLHRQVGTEKSRDDAASAYELAKASLAGAAARVKTAEINLGYTTITAPISGVAGSRIMAEGSLVGTSPDNSLLTRITQLDPAYVHFSFTEREASEIRRLIETGAGKGPEDGKLKVRISFGDRSQYGREGYVDFTDSNLDLQTGTLRARAVVPNPEHKLRPGEFVRVSVEGVTRLNSIVIPQASVMQGPQGRYVYTVDDANKASIRVVTVGAEVDGGWIVEAGLKPGERIVTEGLIKVRPNAEVSPSPATADSSKAVTK